MSTLFVLTSILTIVSGNVDFRSNLNLTGLDFDAWWGPSDQLIEDTTVKRIEVEFRDDMIHDLKHRLRYRRPITPSLLGTWFEYGINSHVVEDWLLYWEKEYPFKERERVMNQFPHYVTNIQGLDIHFIRARPKVPENVTVVPLLLMNGWPNSFAEFYKVIPRLIQLNKERDFAVEVIYPTIPGFTLSEGASRPGLGTPEIGVLMRKLMHRLGHTKYYMASGDLGFLICNFIATVFPEDVLGFHTQMVLLLSLPANVPFFVPAVLPTAVNSIYLGNNTRGRTQADNIRQGAYQYSQATTPDTLGYGMNDSPTGLLSYILQMFHFGMVLDRRENAGAKIQDYIPRDELLDNIMLYWITGSIGTSMRLYAETLNLRVLAMNIDGTPSPVPTWIVHAKYEIYQYPIWILKTKYPNLISYKALEFGGHSLAFEFPEFYADDVLAAITAFRKTALSHLKIEL